MIEKYESVGGGCFCGVVRYEAAVNLQEAYYCHCQKFTGSPAPDCSESIESCQHGTAIDRQYCAVDIAAGATSQQ